MPLLPIFLAVLLVGSLSFQPNSNEAAAMTDVPPPATAAALQALQSDPESWMVRNLSNSFQWMRPRKLLWMIDGKNDQSAVVVEVSEDDWRCLNRPEGLDVLGELMREGIGNFAPRELGARAFALALVQLHQDARAHLCDPEFLARQEKVLFSYIRNKDHGESELRELCANPVTISGANDARWKLNFRVLNRWGGVDNWNVSGSNDPFSFGSVEIAPERPPATFYYPEEF